MKALSIRQPWAWLIVNSHEDVENRTWRTRERGPVLVHASKGMTPTEYEDVCHFLAADERLRHLNHILPLPKDWSAAASSARSTSSIAMSVARQAPTFAAGSTARNSSPDGAWRSRSRTPTGNRCLPPHLDLCLLPLSPSWGQMQGVCRRKNREHVSDRRRDRRHLRRPRPDLPLREVQTPGQHGAHRQRKPNGRPLVVRSHAEAVLSGRATAIDGKGFDVGRFSGRIQYSVLSRRPESTDAPAAFRPPARPPRRHLRSTAHLPGGRRSAKRW